MTEPSAEAVARALTALRDSDLERIRTLPPPPPPLAETAVLPAADDPRVAAALADARSRGLAVKGDPAIPPPAAADKAGQQLALARRMGLAVKTDPPPNAA